MSKHNKLFSRLRKHGLSIADGKPSFTIPPFGIFKIVSVSLTEKDQDSVFLLDGEYACFEYWLGQDLLIFPWITHWFQLNDYFLLKLDPSLLDSLFADAVNKSGNMNELSKALKLSSPSSYNLINGKTSGMISVKKLRRLLNYLDIPYLSINGRIECTRKGQVISIEKPNFPIDLANVNGAHLLGMVVSDGCIYLDRKARNKLRTKYAAGNKESGTIFINLIEDIYGKTHIQKERVRNCDVLKIGSSIIGDSLVKVGGIVGHKAEVDSGVPWVIKAGPQKMKESYLGAVFDDESSVYPDKRGNWGYIVLCRYRHMRDLSGKQKNELLKLNKYMTSRHFPTFHVNKSITVKRASELMTDQVLLSDLRVPPKLLSDESHLLAELGIENRLFANCLCRTHCGRYSLGFYLFISKKLSLKNFYKHVVFLLKHKQKKLIKILGGGDALKNI